MAAKKRIYYKSVTRAILDISESRNKKSQLSKILFYALIILAVVFVAVAPSYIMSYFECSPTVACIPSFVVLGLVFFGANFRKRRALSKFMRVSDVSSKVKLIELGDEMTLQDYKVFYDNDTWIFGSHKDEIVPFIYNWFLSAGIIDEDKKFNVYTIKTDVINRMFKRSIAAKSLDNQAAEVTLIPITEFEFTDEQLDKLIEEAAYVRPFQFERWLRKNYIVPAFFDEGEDEEEPSEAVDAELESEKAGASEVEGTSESEEASNEASEADEA